MKKRESHKTPIIPGTSQEKNPFRTPANYFVELPDEIRSQLGAEAEAPVKVDQWEVIQGWILSLLSPNPAFALLIILIVSGLFLFKDREISESNIYSLTPDEITEYLEDNIDELDVTDFYMIDPESLDPLSSSLDPQELDNYLDELVEDMDLEMIEEVF